MTLNVINPVLGHWTRIEAPTPREPYWRDAEDGTRRDLRELLVGLSAEQAQEIETMHAQAVAELVTASLTAQRAGEYLEARRMAVAAGKLCEQTVGLWPSRLAGPR